MEPTKASLHLGSQLGREWNTEKKSKKSSQNIPKLMNREFMDEILDCSLPFCIIESLQYEDKSVGNDGRFLPELGGIVWIPQNP